MQATRFEYHFRFAIHGILYVLGFWAPWLLIPGMADVPGFTDRSVWLVAASAMARQGWLTFGAATVVLLLVALLFTGLGAWLRLWGSAYVGSGVVYSPAMHGEGADGRGMLTDGPYRRTRNPLYLGTLLHTFGVAVLMPPSGAIFAVSLLWIFQVRLAMAEEPYLAAQFGEAYLAYKRAVPRFLPSTRPQCAAAGTRPHWVQALLGEIYFPAVFLVLAIFGWSFNAQPIRQGLLISLGVWLVVRALLPVAAKPAATMT